MRLLDLARGAYVRSPPTLRRSLAPLLARVPTSARYGDTYRRRREDIERSRTDFAFSGEQRLGAFRRLLAKAHGGSPYYRSLIEAAFGPNPDFTALDVDSLRRLPVLGKKELAAAGTSALAVPRDQVDETKTSGSNGEFPFSFFVDRDRSTREIAFVHSAWSRTGFSPSDARCVLRGFRLDAPGQRNHEWEPALRELRLSVFPMRPEDVREYVDLIDRRGIRYIHGYPSAIELMCRHMLQLGRRPRLPILGVFPISEPVYPHQRRIFAAALGAAPVVPFYGMSEKVLFAAEIPGHEYVYEFEPLYGVAELLDDDGQPVTELGAEGRIVGTGFLSTGMPFIRYDTEDRAILVRPAAADNGWRLQVGGIRPRRKPDFLYGADGRRIVATGFTPDDPDVVRGVSEFQIRQTRPGQCTLRYVLAAGGTAIDAERLRQFLIREAEGALGFDLEEVSSLVTGTHGKRSFIDQRVEGGNI